MISAIVFLVAVQASPVLTPGTPSSSAAVGTTPGAADSRGVSAAGENSDLQVRIMDMVEIDGVRDNQLFGTGIIVGLGDTGDSSNATRTAIANFVRRTHLNVDSREVFAGNVALVSVTATLPPFSAPGTKVDVAVHSIGDAESLFGGLLLQTPLYGADGQAYVVAQGAVSVGGFAFSGDAASVTQNHPFAGVVSNGGIVEAEVPMKMIAQGGTMDLHLRTPNYLTAARLSERLNDLFPGRARALNKATIRMQVPEEYLHNAVHFYSEIGQLRVTPGEEAVVVVNERTGTIVAGHQVRIGTAAISHGNLTITIAESPVVSQPAPFSEGETETVPRTEIAATVEDRDLVVVNGGTSVSDLAAALNQLGVSSRDLISIFQALKAAGHLHARLEIL